VGGGILPRLVTKEACHKKMPKKTFGGIRACVINLVIEGRGGGRIRLKDGGNSPGLEKKGIHREKKIKQ